MNSLTKSVLTLAAYDSNASDISLDNVLRQCLSLLSLFPMLSVYAYHAYNHYLCNDSLYIHRPDPKLTTVEQHGEEVGKSAFSILTGKLEGEEKSNNKIVRTNLVIRGTTK